MSEADKPTVLFTWPTVSVVVLELVYWTAPVTDPARVATLLLVFVKV
jgi:hypothetical protein